GAGNDTLDASHKTHKKYPSTLIGGTGADMLIGNGTTSSASYERTGPGDGVTKNITGVYLDLRRQGMAQIDPEGRETDAVGDTLIGIDHAVGTYSDDTLIGNDQNNDMYGLDGNDLMIGGKGNDYLRGQNGNDTLEGGEGADSLFGDAGFDMVSYENATQGVKIDLSGMGMHQGARQSGDGEENGDEIWYVEGVIGSNHNDTLIGTEDRFGWYEDETYGSMHNLLEGRGGNDLIMGLAGDDTLDGGEGNDTLIGGAGNDLLIGGEGDDLIIGGFTDTVEGGDGFDTFRLEDNIGTGSIFDLSAMNDAGRITGIERIDITGDADDANTLTLRAEDVFEVSGGSLYIDGDTGDTVTTIGAGWTQKTGEVSFGGETYHHYTAQYDSQTVNLYVDVDVTYQTHS
ncbi:MAG: hypothetical protein Q7J24_14885, partial [Desulfomicrobium sp.]|nr:hypothetical protein [Desulfomicrobium sp.]